MEHVLVVTGGSREFVVGPFVSPEAAEWVRARLSASYPALSFRVANKADVETLVGERLDLRRGAGP
jgi:hypothetical protein